MLLTADLAAWLTAIGWTTAVPVMVGSVLPPQPDRALFLTPTGGPGLTLESEFDRAAFQARVRGAQNQPDDAQQLMNTADLLILDAAMPATVGGHRVVSVDRVGSPPSFLIRDSARRDHYVCNYVLMIARH